MPAWAAKDRDERWIGLVPEALAIIERLAERKEPDERLFSGEEHKRAREGACKRIGYGQTITLRDLRTTYMTTGVHVTGDAPAVQASAGHEDLRTTQMYMRSTLERQAKVSIAVAEALGRHRKAGIVDDPEVRADGNALESQTKDGAKKGTRTPDLLITKPHQNNDFKLLAPASDIEQHQETGTCQGGWNHQAESPPSFSAAFRTTIDATKEVPTATITLSSGEIVLIDQADYIRVANCRWWADPHTKNGKRHIYVRGKVPKKDGGHRTVYLHRFLLDAERGQTVFHKNGNGLDNRRHNLEFAFCQQPFEVTDADIEAGELEFEINEALSTAFPGER